MARYPEADAGMLRVSHRLNGTPCRGAHLHGWGWLRGPKRAEEGRRLHIHRLCFYPGWKIHREF